ncbi:WD40-repeat-containing domain protein [Collybia nuda]|uniref:WD40-repeat-containing domain protein n=1 Tax=Collybia nuda TaxID=64659 RepID=A0A9P5YH17_9AGAR|nr:WD40-repeat-containing domain protein [Collybia nuda]
MVDPIRIAAEEVNCLIYAYLQDSGYTHAAFAIRMESKLDRSPLISKHIPRGELIDLLSKSLLYLEVESHWKGDALSVNCKTPFSLLEPHKCSLEHTSVSAMQPPSISIAPLPEPTPALALKTNGNVEASKRKSSPTVGSIEGPAEKRAKRDSDDMEIDSSSESSKAKPSSAEPEKPPIPVPDLSVTKKTAKPKGRIQGPGDDFTNPRVILLLPGHKSEVFVCAFNPKKHRLLATGSKDAVVNLWDLPDPPLVGFAEQPAAPKTLDYFSKDEQGDLTSLHWNSEGTLIAIGSYDSVLRICTSSGELYFQHPQHQGPIFTTRFSKSGRWLLTASLDGTSCLWDVKERRLHKQYRCHTDCCLDVVWLNETTFATCGADQLIYILRVDEDEPIKTLSGHENEINQIKCNPSGTRLASCSDDMTARVWNVDSLSKPADAIPGLVASESIVVLEGHTHSVSAIGWCPDRSLALHPLIATSSFDGTARLWNSVTGECLKVFDDHRRPVYALSFSPDGRWLSTGSGDGWLHIYNVSLQEKEWSWYAGHDRPGVFEIDWQVHQGINRIALALECQQVAVIDVSKIPALGGVAPIVPGRPRINPPR